jgi:hypothetical protein
MNHGYLWITKATSTLVLLALDADTREIVGVAIGARNETAAGQLWNSLAPVYRHTRDTRSARHASCISSNTDFWKHTQQSYRASAIER